jgi:NitT/TauT family transport system ATP-binding protein
MMTTALFGSPVAPGQIELRRVDKSYGHGPAARTVVQGCSFMAEANRFTVMIGPSGAGKSTLARLIAGFEKPNRGEILVGGRTVTGPGRDRLVVFQESALFPWMSAEENIAYGPKATGGWTAETKSLCEFMLDKVGLNGFRRRYPSELSGGMQRRAELARALVNNPAIMILDEPFRGLDAMTRRLMLDYYAGLCEGAPRTNLFITTDIDEAIFLADRLLIMSCLPARVRAIIEVDLPKPRNLTALIRDDRANAIKMEALSLLHEEALKAFTGGSRAATDFVESYRRRLGAG